MRLLLDTQILLWSAQGSGRLSRQAVELIEDLGNELWFSVVSLWEISIKSGLGRTDFRVNSSALRRGLLEHGYHEMPVSGIHALLVRNLPPLHRDPFDRMLITQAQTESLTLLTSDSMVASYPRAIVHV